MTEKRIMQFVWMYANLSELAARQAMETHSEAGSFERNWEDVLRLAKENGLEGCKKKWKK